MRVSSGPPFHKGLRLIASFLNTRFAIELQLISIVRVIATICETGPRWWTVMSDGDVWLTWAASGSGWCSAGVPWWPGPWGPLGPGPPWWCYGSPSSLSDWPPHSAPPATHSPPTEGTRFWQSLQFFYFFYFFYTHFNMDSTMDIQRRTTYINKTLESHFTGKAPCIFKGVKILTKTRTKQQANPRKPNTKNKHLILSFNLATMSVFTLNT